MLALLYGQVDRAYLAAMLDRTYMAMKHRAVCSGLSAQAKPKLAWSEEEDRTLRESFATLPFSDLCLLLPGRTEAAIGCRARDKGLRRELAYVQGAKKRWFWAYPAELQELIRLQREVERKLRDVEAKHRKPARAPLQGAREPRRRQQTA